MHTSTQAMNNNVFKTYSNHDHVYEADSLTELTRIYEAGVNGCLFNSACSQPAIDFSQELMKEEPFFSFTEQIQQANDIYEFNWQRFNAMPGYSEWLKCIHHWTDVFQHLFGAKTMGLRLQSLDRPMCPKFHIDRLTVRGVLTFTGEGTQWLPNHAAKRSRLGVVSAGLEDSVSGVVLDQDAIQSAPTGSFFLLKGEGWEGNEGNGIIHRSPPVSKLGRRLMLSLDLLDCG